jgi:hypothetical protein
VVGHQLCVPGGGRLELSGVFGGSLSLASSATTRAVRTCTCAHSVRINVSFSAWLSWLRSGSWDTRSLNRVARDRVNHDFTRREACLGTATNPGVEQLQAMNGCKGPLVC